MLFADVKGSMDLAEQVGPEELHHILDSFFAILLEEIHRCEGTVNQFTGDGIMALFGAPIAHEDHPQRACYAALRLTERVQDYAQELRRERGLDFAVRMGLNSGEVVVGKIGDDLRMDYTAQGHTVGLGARITQIAEGGKVYLTEATASRVSGFFELEDLGEFKLKGVRSPTRVYSLEGIGPWRTRFDLARARGFSKFVGRTDELRDLEVALEHAIEGQGQVVGVVGEIGVGKSRLCDEFLERCRESGVRVVEGHAVPHGRMIPYLPILELFRSYFGIADREAPEEARRKIAGTLVLADQSLDQALPLVFEFMGVPDPARPAPPTDADARQRQLFGALRQMLHARGQHEPTVLLVEDLHWLDGASEAFLEPIADAATASRLLLLITFRPEFHARWMQRSRYHQLPLLPLGPAAIDELVRDLIGDDESGASFREMLRQRTDGNPFFIEEVVLSLAEAGVLEGSRGSFKLVRPMDEIEIPESVRTVLAARIDRLESRDKTVLEAAAVVGRVFSERLLAHVLAMPEEELRGALHELVESEFIYERALYPEPQFAFKHPVTREVAYGSQLGERRARTHRAVAEAVEELYRPNVDSHAGLLAHHWELAGELWAAARWHDLAARQAVLTHPGEATRHWLKVRTLLDGVEDSVPTADLRIAACTQILNLGWHLGLSDDEVSAVFSEGRALAEARDDLPALAGLYRAFALSTLVAGSVEESEKWLNAAVPLAERAGDEGMLAALQTSLILSHFWAGRLGEALGTAQELVDRGSEKLWVGSEILGYSPYLWARFVKGSLLVRMGHLNDAENEIERTLALARKHGDTFVLGHTHHAYALLEGYRGDVEKARLRAREAIEMFEGMGSTSQTAYGYLRLGSAQGLGQEWKEATASLERALSIARERRLLVSEAEILAHLAEAYLGLGRERRALETAEEAIRAARRRGTRLHECDGHLALARILLRIEGAHARERIEWALAAVERLAGETGARVHLPFVRLERAELARLLGDGTTRQQELRDAYNLFTQMGATGHAEQLSGRLGV